MDTLITDRTQADVDRARYLNGLWDPRALQWRGTPQERAEWEAGPRGAYGYADMNRVTQAAAYLIGRLEELGYSVDVEDVTPAYNIQISVDPAGGGVVSGAGAYYEGDTVTVTAQPGEKYNFAGWKENGQVVSESASYSFTVTGPRDLTAEFALKKFQVIVSVDPAGSGEVTGAGTYDIDTEVTVASTAEESYVFTRWVEAGETVSEDPQYTFTLAGDRMLSAVMTKTYVISATANDTDGGTVTGGGTYLDGQTVTVAAVAVDGYEFTGWAENGAVVSSEAVYSFQVVADRSLVAVFVATHEITLLVSPAGAGTVAGAGMYLEGQQAVVTATPASGYRFVEWFENGEPIEPELRLPDGYTELEYIESNGTQYIDTQINPSTETSIVLDVYLGGYSSTSWLFGARDSSDTTAEFQYMVARTADTRLQVRYFGGSKNLTNVDGLSGRTILMQEKNKLSSGGVSVEANKPSGVKTCSYPLYLFTYNNIGRVGARCSAKLYSCKMYDDGVLIRDYIPCINPDGEAGLYDLSQGAFYENAGTGEFVPGPVVQG